MKCSYTTDDIITYSEGGFTPEERSEIKSHIDVCQNCRQVSEILLATDNFIAEETVIANPNFDGILLRIDTQRYSKKGFKIVLENIFARISPVLKPVSAFGLLIVAIFSLFQLSHFLGHSIFGQNSGQMINSDTSYIQPGLYSFNATYEATPPENLLFQDSIPDQLPVAIQPVTLNMNPFVEIKLFQKNPSTGPVEAYIQEGTRCIPLGQVGAGPASKVEVIQTQFDAGLRIGFVDNSSYSPVHTLLISYITSQNQWQKTLVNNNYFELDADSDGKNEYAKVIAGQNVILFHENGVSYAQMDIKKLSDSTRTFLHRGTINWFETIMANGRHNYFILSDQKFTSLPTPLEDRYLLSDSSQRLLSKDDVENLSIHQLDIARNEIYARHGYDFKLSQFKDYFLHKFWYNPDSSFSDGLLSKIEKDNIFLIKNTSEALNQNLTELVSPSQLDLNGSGKKENVTYSINSTKNEFTINSPSFSYTSNGNHFSNALYSTKINTTDPKTQLFIVDTMSNGIKKAKFLYLNDNNLTSIGEVQFVDNGIKLPGDGSIKVLRPGKLSSTYYLWDSYLYSHGTFVAPKSQHYQMNQKAIILNNLTLSEKSDSYKPGFSLNKLDVVTLTETDDQHYLAIQNEKGQVGYILIDPTHLVSGTNLIVNDIIKVFTSFE